MLDMCDTVWFGYITHAEMNVAFVDRYICDYINVIRPIRTELRIYNINNFVRLLTGS